LELSNNQDTRILTSNGAPKAAVGAQECIEAIGYRSVDALAPTFIDGLVVFMSQSRKARG
jgi:hypothetical protein